MIERLMDGNAVKDEDDIENYIFDQGKCWNGSDRTKGKHDLFR